MAASLLPVLWPILFLFFLQAYYDTLQSQTVDLIMWRHYSPTDTYLYVVTSTVEPATDNYMVFTVTSTELVPQINYVVNSVVINEMGVSWE